MKVPYDLQEAWIIREELSCDELASLRIVYWAWMDGFIVTIEEAGIVTGTSVTFGLFAPFGIYLRVRTFSVSP